MSMITSRSTDVGIPHQRRYPAPWPPPSQYERHTMHWARTFTADFCLCLAGQPGLLPRAGL